MCVLNHCIYGFVWSLCQGTQPLYMEKWMNMFIFEELVLRCAFKLSPEETREKLRPDFWAPIKRSKEENHSPRGLLETRAMSGLPLACPTFSWPSQQCCNAQVQRSDSQLGHTFHELYILDLSVEHPLKQTCCNYFFFFCGGGGTKLNLWCLWRNLYQSLK